MLNLRCQSGFTLKGMIMGCIVIGIVAVLAMRLFPLYNKKLKIDASMTYVSNQPGVGRETTSGVIKMLISNFDIQDVEGYDKQSLRENVEVARIKGSPNKLLTFKDEFRNKLFGNLEIVMNYEKSVELPSGAGP